MAGLWRRVSIGVLVSSFTTMCFAQGMVDYAAAAATGSAGGAGGKSVSDALDKIFKKTDDQLKQNQELADAAKAAKSRTLAQQKASGGTAGAQASASGTSSAVAPRKSGPSLASPGVESALQQALLPTTAPPRVIATPEAFSKLTAGIAAGDLAGRLGAPAYKISMQEDGHLLEIYRYSANGTDLGSVRVVDGSVAEVRQNRN